MANNTSAPDRLPPQNLDAERSVLGSILRDNFVLDDVAPLLRAESFYTDGHQKIYAAILALKDRNRPIDLVTLAEELRQRGQVDDIGGYAYLGELWEAVGTAANARHYSEIVKDKATLRHLIHTSTEILRDAYEQSQPAEELLNSAEHRIFEIAQMGVTGEAQTLEQAINLAYERIDKRTAGEATSISGISTGFSHLDELTAGLQNKEFIVIAARPSVGKTGFALALTRNIAVESRETVLFCSLEQARVELAERLLCSQARVESHKLRSGRLGADDITKIVSAGGILRNAKVFIDDTPSQGMLRIAANARRLKRQHNLRLLVIDYLQLIEPENRRDPRQEQVAQISRRLKQLARELEIPVVALAQVNRQSEDRQDHRPRLSDLRESGSIEADADVVMMLHRADRYEPGQRQGEIEVIIAKQRNGPTGEVILGYRREFFLYEDHAPESAFTP
jgi:replicative DNA helicase